MLTIEVLLKQECKDCEMSEKTAGMYLLGILPTCSDTMQIHCVIVVKGLHLGLTLATWDWDYVLVYICLGHLKLLMSLTLSY